MATIEDSSDQDKQSLSRLRSNSYGRAVSDDPSEEKQPPPTPPEVKQPPLKPSENERHDNDIYVIKWIEFNHERLPILLQNKNGPCPLLALANILLLRKQVKFF